MNDDPRRSRHELRTPVNHILSYARLVLEEAEALGLIDLTSRMQAIESAGQRALALIDDVLASEPGAGAELRALMVEVGEYATLLQAEVTGAGTGELTSDLRRIQEAAERLAALVGGIPHPAVPPHPREAHVSREAHLFREADLFPTPLTPDPPLPLGEGRGEGLPSGTLLVVDDNEGNRDVLSRSLERLGYTVVCAEHGRRALEVLATGEIDLVLLDIMMPELDGYQVLEQRRSDPRLRDIPFIMISAADDAESVIRCVEMGAEDYLPKPFDPVLLRARIGACLEKKRLHDQEKQHLATIQAQAAELAEWNRTLERRVADQVAQLDRVGRLKRFLPAQLAELIVATGDEALLESHRRHIAVVFCDLRGFTPFSETAEPEVVMDVLGEYHAAMGELISRFEGTVEHFAGDGLMVLFNDPLPCSDPEVRAVRMAVAMRERMAELSAVWRRRGHTLGFGVGISVGYATLGQIGFEGRFHYAAIGSMVNLAARLCGEARDGQILASQRVCAVIEDLAIVDPVGELSLKGFRDPVAAFEIVSLNEPGPVDAEASR